jgi:phage gp29-like protein
MAHHDPIADAKAQEATQQFTFRPATMEDIPALQTMIGDSLRALGKGYYSEAELEGSIGYLFGPDTVLIRDQ